MAEAPPSVRVSTTMPVIRLSAPRPAGGMWMEGQSTRDRRGLVGAMYGGVLSRVAPAGMSRTVRLLTADQRRQLYETTPDVRACVDSIARRIATWDWNVKPKLDPRDNGYEAAQKAADEAAAWLAAPNLDGETWQEVIVKMVTDLLTDDSGVWELVSDGNGVALKEINVLRGAYVFPILGVHGRIAAFIQDPSGMGTFDPSQIDAALRQAGANPLDEATKASSQPGVGPSMVAFKPEDIVQFRLFPNTAWPALGMPLLESLVNECVTVLLAADHLVVAYDADEIPPGLLVVGGLAGQAAKQAREDFANMRGKDGKIRLIASETPGMVDAKWVELRRTLKDLELAEVIKEVRRTIWRVFGVMPIELGQTEDMPRAVGAEMVDVGKSHLLEPILELIQAKVNARVLPRLVGKQYAGILKFEFDRRAKLSPEEERAEQEAFAVAHKRGAITTNEWRAARGLRPYGKEGDIPLIDTNDGPMPLVEAVKRKFVAAPPPGSVPPGGGTPPGKEGEEEEGKDGKGGEDGKGGVPEDGKEEPEEEAPGESRGALPTSGPACSHRAHSPTNDDLPSDWQPEGRFKGMRTVDLSALAYAVSEYEQRVSPLYRAATLDVLAAVREAYAPGATDAEDAERAERKAGDVLDRLAARWSSDTIDLYRSTVDASVRQVRDWTGYDVDRKEREARADRYHDAAMGYLSAPDGLLGALRSIVDEVLRRVTATGHRSLDGADDALVEAVKKALQGETPATASAGTSAVAKISALTSNSTEAEVVDALSSGFEAQAYRTGNWSGKLVELANETLAETLGEQALAANTDPNRDLSAPATEWWYEWCAVSDGATCRVCEHEGARGFQPGSAFTFVPGSQQTLCKARCRCVLVAWLRSEIDAGTAISLSGYAP